MTKSKQREFERWAKAISKSSGVNYKQCLDYVKSTTYYKLFLTGEH